MDKSNKKLTRRNFLKTAAIAGAAGAMTSCVTTGHGESGGKLLWDKEADVVILGYGGAGACAGITAKEAGASVLIIEKQEEATHYSNTRMSGGIYHCPDKTGNKQALKEYAKAMFSGENIPGKLEGEQPDVSDGLAEAWAEYTPGLTDWLKSLDSEFVTIERPGFKGAAFPNFPGAKESGYAVVAASYTGKLGGGPTKHLPKNQTENGEALWRNLDGACKAKGAQVMYETSGVSLITNSDGEIIGINAKSEKTGALLKIKANRGVILSSGGYEYNEAMRRAFLEGPGVEGWAFYGTTHNTGAGIEMAIKVGAKLVKVGKAASRMITAVPLRAHGMKIGVITPVVGQANSMVVDNSGHRFAAEHKVTRDPSRYFFYKEGVKFDIDTLTYPRIPSWLIFDETMRSTKCITELRASVAAYDYVPWTADNMDAVNRGWILKGNTLEELADKIRKHPENFEKMTTKDLINAVKKYNEACTKGDDVEFKRDPKTLGPVEKAPFYALPLYPGGPNTKGGIASDAARHVLDWENKPIPRLFCAGEIASALKFVYQGGGNLTECMVFGRIAGASAAAMKPWA